ncbi:MAG: FkbM family methyltransferase, partial [Lachnospiraceae bacterium]|nr:FkbM family methyltransferase [Lachnospiraceae bacterium]
MSINCDYIGIEEYSRLFGFLANNYFAGYGVDANVIEVLERTGYKIEKMNYIEIGATHPILGSATYAMYLKGARGVLVEPNPDCISEMKRLRPDDICLNCGVGAENETLKFYRFDNKYRNSFDISVVNENIGKGYKLIDEIDIEVKTLETIIDESGLDVSSTYISLQVLGLEYEILRKFDYKKYNFPIIRVACY